MIIFLRMNSPDAYFSTQKLTEQEGLVPALYRIFARTYKFEYDLFHQVYQQLLDHLYDKLIEMDKSGAIVTQTNTFLSL